jgi:hypothetical protein
MSDVLSSVSQRDLQRVFRAFDFFWGHYLKRNPDKAKDIQDPSNAEVRKMLLNRTITLSIGLVYYLRLDTDLRSDLNNALLSLCQLSVKKTLEEEMTLYFDHIKLERGIALTNALMENVFAIIVCLQLRTPLIMIGPPGSSKTLKTSLLTPTFA